MTATTIPVRKCGRRTCLLVFLFFTVTTSSGCLGFLHPVVPPSEHICCSPPPRCCRDHVYVFIVHGLDPLDYANLRGVREYIHCLGYANVTLGQMYHAHPFAEKIREIHACDPEARFVLMGFSAGANVVNLMCHSLHEKNGITIDLLVYLGGNTLKDEPKSIPPNVIQVHHILATGYIWKGYPLSGADNRKYGNAWHFDSPTHPETLRLLTIELPIVASRVTGHLERYIDPKEELPAPTPRPVKQVKLSPSSEWDYLRPAKALRVAGHEPGWFVPDEEAKIGQQLPGEIKDADAAADNKPAGPTQPIQP